VIQLSTFFEGSLFNTSIIFLQFYPRPGTAAAKMKLLPTNVGKSRTKKLTKLFKAMNLIKAGLVFVVRFLSLIFHMIRNTLLDIMNITNR